MAEKHTAIDPRKDLERGRRHLKRMATFAKGMVDGSDVATRACAAEFGNMIAALTAALTNATADARNYNRFATFPGWSLHRLAAECDQVSREPDPRTMRERLSLVFLDPDDYLTNVAFGIERVLESYAYDGDTA